MKYDIHVEVDEDGMAFIYDRTLGTNEMIAFMPFMKANAIADKIKSLYYKYDRSSRTTNNK